jgi:hypothetical protein
MLLLKAAAELPILFHATRSLLSCFSLCKAFIAKLTPLQNATGYGTTTEGVEGTRGTHYTTESDRTAAGYGTGTYGRDQRRGRSGLERRGSSSSSSSSSSSPSPTRRGVGHEGMTGTTTAGTATGGGMMAKAKEMLVDRPVEAVKVRVGGGGSYGEGCTDCLESRVFVGM